tara:strand:- start:279 stop:470 length:192 start_codon:yes stop_codon:yes gene_type:complete
MPIITVEWMVGKTKEQKAQLAKAMTEAMSEVIGSPPEATQVLINDHPMENWSIGGTLFSDRED